VAAPQPADSAIPSPMTAERRHRTGRSAHFTHRELAIDR
jgi:hypothetical protein